MTRIKSLLTISQVFYSSHVVNTFTVSQGFFLQFFFSCKKICLGVCSMFIIPDNAAADVHFLDPHQSKCSLRRTHTLHSL